MCPLFKFLITQNLKLKYQNKIVKLHESEVMIVAHIYTFFFTSKIISYLFKKLLSKLSK
jgi:hypothetical protein